MGIHWPHSNGLAGFGHHHPLPNLRFSRLLSLAASYGFTGTLVSSFGGATAAAAAAAGVTAMVWRSCCVSWLVCLVCAGCASCTPTPHTLTTNSYRRSRSTPRCVVGGRASRSPAVCSVWVGVASYSSAHSCAMSLYVLCTWTELTPAHACLLLLLLLTLPLQVCKYIDIPLVSAAGQRHDACRCHQQPMWRHCLHVVSPWRWRLCWVLPRLPHGQPVIGCFCLHAAAPMGDWKAGC